MEPSHSPSEKREQSSSDHSKSSHFFSVTSTPHEISVLTGNEGLARIIELVAGKEKQEQEKQLIAQTMQWRALKIAGPLDLTMVGVMHAFTTALTQAQVSIFAISTYLTDYVLVKQEALDKATEALRKAGWHVKEP